MRRASSSDRKLRRLSFLSLACAVGLGLALLGGALFSTWASSVDQTQAAQADRASLIAHFYSDAAEALRRERLYADKYAATPDNSILRGYRDAVSDVELALQSIANAGSLAERTTVGDLLDEHTAFVLKTKQMFDVASGGDRARALVMDRTIGYPMYAQLMSRAVGHKTVWDGLAGREGQQLQDRQRIVPTFMALLSLVGFVLLVVFFYVLRTFRRYIDEVHADELRRLEEAALTDNLTNLGNHRAFQEELEQAMARASRYQESVSLALLDVDEFKLLNDLKGHQCGDQALVTIADLLRGLRNTDRSFRIGGDEFAVLLPHTPAKEATIVMQRLLSLVQAQLGGATISVGVASSASASGDVEILRGQTDAALYAAKRSGRNAVEAFDDSKDGMWLLSGAKMRALRRLLFEGDVRVAFQQIWGLENCKVLAYEALSRPDVRYGFTGPQDAFDLAERMGRSPELDEVCRKAIFQRAYDLPADTLLFVNISPQTLERDALDGMRLMDMARGAGMTPDRVVIEITEKSVAKLDAVVAAAHELRRYGFRLALDDTGSGNSGLEILSKLPIDFVKIDRTIIVKALADAGARGVLAGIIAIARAIGAYVIAEGIETEEMLALACRPDFSESARARGVDGVQGYLLHRPSEAIPDAETIAASAAMLRKLSNAAAMRRGVAS